MSDRDRSPDDSTPEKAPSEDADATPESPKPEGPASGGPQRVERRFFFVEGLRNILRPVADVLEDRLEHARRSFEEVSRNDIPDYPRGPSIELEGRILRPPGALEERLFLERCSRCYQCIAVCPVQAIAVLDHEDEEKSGTPYIDPSVQACVVCEDLACMQTCPSGALQKIPAHAIHMGLAELQRDTCLRTDGEDCQICVEKCPLGEKAIEIPYQGADVEVKTDGCIGCGVCEMYCPTEPRAIVIKPA